jgi:hypothetical protein
MNLEIFKNNLTKSIFNQTTNEAQSTELCIQCKEPALPKCYSEMGKREYYISGLCEECFDGIFKRKKNK